jgi:hypothetical protein
MFINSKSFFIWIEYNHSEQYELLLGELFLKFIRLNSEKLHQALPEYLLSFVSKRLTR